MARRNWRFGYSNRCRERRMIRRRIRTLKLLLKVDSLQKQSDLNSARFDRSIINATFAKGGAQ
jgi:hypothetical protein